MVRALSFTTLLLIAVPAMAQNPQPTSPTNPTVPVAPPNSASPPPEKIAPSDGSLSGRLAQQKGTITPPNVDPGMTVSPPAHNGAKTPVIPPPGSPGGNQSVVPK
jgi:hypothetical protein